MKGIARSRWWNVPVLAICSLWLGSPASADPIRVGWPQPAGPGTDVVITYSYSNLLDGSFLRLSASELRAATEEALRLWAAHAPLHFRERLDSGPPPSDAPYDATGFPLIRIGHADIPELARGFIPGSDGLAGDIHFSPSVPWTLGPSRWNFLEAVTHELGHSLGLQHVEDAFAIMNPFFPEPRFGGLGSGFLAPPDIRQLHALYGSGVGSVEPIPEPATLLLVGTGILGVTRLARRRSRRAEN